MKIAITGASGQFGRRATQLLIEGGVAPSDLILITRSPESLAEAVEQGCVVRRGDFDDRDSLVEALAGAERMLMISGTRVGFREPQHTNAVEAAKAAGVRHIVYTSFIATVRSNPSLAVKDHLFTEELLRSSGLVWTSLRDAQYSEAVVDAMGPLTLAKGEMVSLALDGAMAFVSREDCVASAVAVLVGEGHESRAYDITGPELLTRRQVAELLTDVTGRPIACVATDEEGMFAMFDAIGVPRKPVDGHVASNFPWNSEDMVSFDVATRDGHFAIISDDVERLTGRKPRTLRSLLEADIDKLLAAVDQVA